MEYKNITEFIKHKKLMINDLIGKKIIYKAEKEKELREFEIVEIINSPLAHHSAYMKLTDCLSHNAQKLWKFIKMADIKFVKIEPEKDKFVDKIADDANNWLETLQKMQAAKGARRDQDKMYPPYPPVPSKFPLDKDKIICKQCGIDCSGTMGYCCSQAPCPMGMGGTICSATTKDSSVKSETFSPQEKPITGHWSL